MIVGTAVQQRTRKCLVQTTVRSAGDGRNGDVNEQPGCAMSAIRHTPFQDCVDVPPFPCTYPAERVCLSSLTFDG